jgi:hypothetical protein
VYCFFKPGLVAKWYIKSNGCFIKMRGEYLFLVAKLILTNILSHVIFHAMTYFTKGSPVIIFITYITVPVFLISTAVMQHVSLLIDDCLNFIPIIYDRHPTTGRLICELLEFITPLDPFDPRVRRVLHNTILD